MKLVHAILAFVTIALLTVTLLPGTAGAEEKKYPPYPDIWGRVIPAPEGSMPAVRVYDNPDGDRLIRIVFEKMTKGVERREWWTLAFFGGELKEIDVEEADRLFRAYRKTGLYRKSRVDKISHAGTPNSGFSFGPAQWDMRG